ncbi:MAG: NIPSNAP family protein [Dehalococcoidia bacterium]
MIYELRTYTLKPGSAAEFEKRWAPMVPGRQQLSPMAALWRTEIGPLNQMVHIWPYESLDERTRIRREAVERGVWPPDTSELIEQMESEILLPAPFMRPLVPAALGGIYEMRTYTYRPGTMPEVLKIWGERIANRERYSPLAACWYSDIGSLNRFIHVWPYVNLAERDRIRTEASADPAWPPPTGKHLVRMENKILVPVAFSPLH